MTGSAARAAFLIISCLLVAMVGSHAATAAPPSRAPALYKVPTKIKDDCSVPVDAKISAWLATVSDISTVQFGAGRC